MPQGYIPGRESELVNWGQNYLDQVANLGAPALGLTEPQANELAARFEAFRAAFVLANQNTTRTPDVIQTKKTAKKAFIAEARTVTKIVQAYPGTTDTMRTSLKITVPDPDPTPVPVPAEAPKVTVAEVEGRLIRLQLRKDDSESRAKPAGVRAAWLYSFVGEEMPTFEQMKFRGATGKADTQIVLPPDVATGSKVWISACWVNSSDKPGPVSLPVFTWTNHGAMQNVAA